MDTKAEKIKVKNILVLTYWDYRDALIQTYTLPYLRIIRKHISNNARIYLLLIEKKPFLNRNDFNTLKTKSAQEGIHLLRIKYRSFGPVMLFRLIFLIKRLFFLILFRKINVIHAWCTPAGALGYYLSRFTGRKLVLDSFEPHAEASVENGSWQKNSKRFNYLFKLEKKQAARASKLILTTKGMQSYIQNKYKLNIAEEKLFVKPACVNYEDFSETTEPEKIKLKQDLGIKDNNFLAIYAGKLGGIYYDTEVFQFMKAAYDYWDGNLNWILLSGEDEGKVKKMCKDNGLPLDAVKHLFVPHHEVKKYLAIADFGLTPVKPVPTKRYCTPIKDGEYWSSGLPVVISDNISDDSELIKENNAGVIVDFENPESYSTAIKKLEQIIKEKGHKDRIRQLAKNYRSFTLAEKVYAEIYE